MHLRPHGTSLPVTLLPGLLLPVINAQFSSWGGFGYSEGGALYPIGADSAYWKAAVAFSNASAVFSIPGRDVTKPWPGVPMDGWTLNITVDVTPYDVGTDLRIIAPESLYKKINPNSVNGTEEGDIRDAGGEVIPNVNSDWIVCSWSSFGPDSYSNISDALNPKNIPTKPDGDCSPWLSDACITAIEKAASTSYSTDIDIRINPYNARALCQGFDMPEECAGSKLESPDWPWSLPDLPTRYLTGATTFVDGYEIKQEGDSSDTKPPLEDAPLMWNSITRDYIGVVTMFGRYKKDASTDDVEPGFTKLSCIRPESRVAAVKNSGDQPGNKTSSEDKESMASAWQVFSIPLLAALAAILY